MQQGHFVQGRTYNRRRDIHERFGGQQRGGMITPKGLSAVILVTGEEGLEHGYRDRWEGDTFYYFGHGQVGAMQLRMGNKALAEHSRDGKAVLLFKSKKRDLVFEGEMVLEGYHTEQEVDREGRLREAIVFRLRRIDAIPEHASVSPTPSTETIDELRRRAYAAAGVANSRTVTRTVYERSEDVRNYVLTRAGEKCEGCEAPAPFRRANGTAYLEPHHLRRVSDRGPDHPRYVIGLCPTCHRRAHHAIDAEEFNSSLLAKMTRIERGQEH